MSITMSLLPLSARLRSPFVSVSCSTTATKSSLIVVRALVGPRPVYSRVHCTIAVEIAAGTLSGACWVKSSIRKPSDLSPGQSHAQGAEGRPRRVLVPRHVRRGRLARLTGAGLVALGVLRDPEQFGRQVPLWLELERVVEHGPPGQGPHFGDQPLAFRFADRHPRLADEIRAAAVDEETLVRNEDVTEEGDVARLEPVGDGPYRATAEDLAVELHQRG